MISKHINSNSMLSDSMKSRLLRPTRLAAMLLGAAPLLVPGVALALVDERTPPAPPAPIVATTPQPAPVAAKHIGHAPTHREAPASVVPSVIPAKPAPAHSVFTPQAVPFQAGVRGDVHQSAWQGRYPGPYGSMPLAAALIAQIRPVVGRAIEINGPEGLLAHPVFVEKGKSRIETLRQMAMAADVGILIQGNAVSLASAGTPGPSHLDGRIQTQPVASAEPLVVKKDWDLKVGAMLSTELMQWAQDWGWRVVWKANVDYRIAAPIHVHDTFLGGVGQVLDAYKNGNRPLWGDFNKAQKVLVIREPSSADLGQ